MARFVLSLLAALVAAEPRFLQANTTEAAAGNSTEEATSKGCTPSKNTICNEYASLKIMGASGKFLLGAPDMDPNSDPKAITVIMDAIKEVDANGVAVGAKGASKHSRNSFAPVDFAIADPVEKEVGDAKVTAVDFDAEVVEGSGKNLLVSTMIGTSAGNFTIGEEGCEASENCEIARLEEGALKFNVALPSNWPWCDTAAANCGSGKSTEHGEAVLLTISLKSRQDMTLTEAELPGGIKVPALQMGEDAIMVLSKLVKVNGTYVQMPTLGETEYPLLETQGASASLTIALPRNGASVDDTFEVVYDPIIIPSSIVDDTTDNTDEDDNTDGGDKTDNSDEDDNSDGDDSTDVTTTTTTKKPSGAASLAATVALAISAAVLM